MLSLTPPQYMRDIVVARMKETLSKKAPAAAASADATALKDEVAQLQQQVARLQEALKKEKEKQVKEKEDKKGGFFSGLLA